MPRARYPGQSTTRPLHLLVQHPGALLGTSLTGFRNDGCPAISAVYALGQEEAGADWGALSEKLLKVPTDLLCKEGRAPELPYLKRSLQRPALSALAWLCRVGTHQRSPIPQATFKYPTPLDSAHQPASKEAT